MAAVPSVAPTEIYNLPPQAAPSLTFAPTLDASSTNPAVHFRITALAFLFSLSGVIFTLLLIRQSVVFLLKKGWRQEDLSKWELDRQREEKRRLLEEIESGQRKPEVGIQFDENDVNDQEARHLQPSWVRERDFSMQWEDFDFADADLSSGCKILIANPSRWAGGPEEKRGREKAGDSGVSGGAGLGNCAGGAKSARVMRKNKRVRPNDVVLEVGSVVTVRTPYSPSIAVLTPTRYRPGKLLALSPESGLYEVEYTDSEGGVAPAVPKDAIQSLAEFTS